MKEKCILYDRDCIDCGECEFCDLDPNKLCDNCGKCLNMDGKGYATIKIDKIFYDRAVDFAENSEVEKGESHCHHDGCDCDDCHC